MSVFRFRLPSFVKSDEVGYFAVLYTAVVVARVSHASRLVFMRTLVCALSGVFSCVSPNKTPALAQEWAVWSKRNAQYGLGY